MLKLSASNLYRYFICPAAMLHEQGYAEKKITKYSEDGTLKHKEMQEAFEKPEGYNKSEAAKSLITALRVYTQLPFFAHCVVLEEKIRYKFPEFELVGTPDFVYYSQTNVGSVDIFIIDYKFGYQKVLAKDNVQLLAYALLLESQRTLGVQFNYHVGIWQDDILDIVKVTSEEVNQFLFQLTEIVISAIGHTPVYKPSETGCKWCQHRPNCHEINLYVEEGQQLIETNLNKKLTHLQKYEYRKKLLQSKKIIEYALEDAEDYFKKELANGAMLDFCELKSNGSMKSWSKNFTENEILSALAKASGRTEDYFIDLKLKSVSQVKGLFADIPEDLIESREKAKSLKVKEKEGYGKKQITDDLF